LAQRVQGYKICFCQGRRLLRNKEIGLERPLATKMR
jgi:hypothetical protein